MKVVLFCGGLGTRLREYSDTIPKPLVPIGNRPIIWHLMKYYASFGHNDFILCLGYRGDLIKDYFLDYKETTSNNFVWSRGGEDVELLGRDISDWRITFVDTGLKSNIGQRLKAVEKYVGDDEYFLANYSDGLSDLPLAQHIAEAQAKQATAMFVSVRPSQTYHTVDVDEHGEVRQIEYIGAADHWINGGFFVLHRRIFGYLKDGAELVEEPFRQLIRERKLFSRRYEGFWASMDTFKDKKRFDDMYEAGQTPWMVW